MVCLHRGRVGVVDNSRGWAAKAGNGNLNYVNVGMKLDSSMVLD